MKIEHRVEMVDGYIKQQEFIVSGRTESLKYAEICRLSPQELLSLKELLANYEIK